MHINLPVIILSIGIILFGCEQLIQIKQNAELIDQINYLNQLVEGNGGGR